MTAITNKCVTPSLTEIIDSKLDRIVRRTIEIGSLVPFKRNQRETVIQPLTYAVMERTNHG